MLGYAKIYRDRVFAEGKAEGIVEGKAEGIVEGKAEGIAEGKVEQHLIFLEWNHRRIQAEKDGKVFTEPVPAPEET